MAFADSHITDAAWAHCEAVLRPVLALAPVNYLDDVAGRLTEHGIQAAVVDHDTGAICEWMLHLIDRQGISNRAAIAFAARQGRVEWHKLNEELAAQPRCPLLQSHWHFDGCGYRKDQHFCSRPDLFDACPVPHVGSRKGSLSQAAVGLALFVRDVCGGDIVAWIDHRLAGADRGAGGADRTASWRAGLLDPLQNVVGTGPKVWSMIYAELLLGADPHRKRWVIAGASFVAADSLVHGFLHRTGILGRLGAAHAYGAACHGPSGCTDVITALAARIDARDYNSAFPRCFPRWVQFAIWLFAAEGGWGVCNGNQIADRERCRQSFCPVYRVCDRTALYAPIE